MFGLLDCNNFYVSCYRAFTPSLKNHPVVVLGNNNGCCVARSNEAKALGIKMGQPWHECRELAEEHGVVALGANFPLFGDLSNRIMSLAAGLGDPLYVYSIDEAFASMSGIRGDLVTRGEAMRKRILQCAGIPTGIGFGQTKTLAKLANHVAKTADRKPGIYPPEFARVCNLAALPASDLDAVLQATDVGDVWGIGKRIGQQLHDQGINNVLQLVQLDPATVRRRWSLVLERTIRELQGQSCIPMELAPPPKREIAFTRSFGQPVTALHELTEAITEFTSRASVKLRLQGGRAMQIGVFINTSPFRPPPHYSRYTTIPLRRPTADTQELVKAAVAGLRAIYREGVAFARAGVMLLDLVDASIEQHELDLEAPPPLSRGLMQSLDRLNDRYGMGTVYLASAGTGGDARPWTAKQSLRTPAYTTDWNDLPVAQA